MRWIWVRHGQTEQNRLGCYLGHQDVPLNEKGRAQIEQLVMSGLPSLGQVSRFFCSDLARCRETAEILVSGQRRFDSTDALRELHFGDWDGKRYEELMAIDPDRLGEWYKDPFHRAPPGGETLVEMGNRVDAWLTQWLESLDEADEVLVVTHGGPLRWVLSRWILGDSSKFWEVQGAAHGGGFVVEWDGVHWGEPQFFGGEK